MQYQLQIFEDEHQRQFRTMHIDGEPWFVGVDVCGALDIKNPSDAYSRLDDDDLGTAEAIDSMGRKQLLKIVSESGLYALIFQSRRPEAKRFKKWVTSEVLPSIRRTGGYRGTAEPVPAIWQPFHDRISLNWGAVPDGYFSVFKEMADLMATIIRAGVAVDARFIPDISVGGVWGRFWEENGLVHDYGARVGYLHNYPPSFPQARSNPQQAWAYPDEALPAFRRWAKGTYFTKHLPEYLSRKARAGELPVAFADAVLHAIGVEPPTPRITLR